MSFLNFHTTNMKKILFVSSLILLCLFSGYAQLVEFNFSAAPYLEASSLNSQLTATAVSLSSGTISTNQEAGTYFSNEPYIAEAGGWGETSYQNGKYFTFSLEAQAGYLFNLNTFSFEAYATSAGPSALTVLVNNDSLFTCNITDALQQISIPLSSYSQLQTVECKIIGWDNASRDVSGGGSLKLDELMLTGSVDELTIEASQIRADHFPGMVFTDSTFSIALSACDTYGNVDESYAESFSLSTQSSVASLLTPATYLPAFTQGTFSASGFTLDASDTLSFEISSTDLSPYTQQTLCGAPLAQQQLAAKGLSPWQNTQDWDTLVTDSLVYITHDLQDVSGTSYLSRAYETDQLMGQGLCVWRLQLINGNFDPTSSNKFWYYIMASEPDLSSETLYGYAVGVNMTGSNDSLSLWRIDADGSGTKLIESGFDWDENTCGALEVRRNNQGYWQLAWNTEGSYNNMNQSISRQDLQYNELLYHGLVFTYTSTRAGLLQCSPADFFLMNEAPALLSATTPGKTEIKLRFSEPLNTENIQTSDFILRNTHGEQISIHQVSANSTSTTLSLSCDTLQTGSYHIQFAGAMDRSGRTRQQLSLSFDYQLQARWNDLVFNEVMADPQDWYGLPAAEYVELYNRLNEAVPLYNWLFAYGNSTPRELDSALMEAHSYAILCHTDDTALFTPYGQVIGVSSMPSLAQTGEIMLYDADTQLINYLPYEDAWITEGLKAQGGYSLERIDPDNGNPKANWLGCEASRGGTPGAANSVAASNADTEAPNLLRVYPEDNYTLKLYFNEAIDYSTLSHNDFLLNNAVTPDEISWEEPAFKTLSLTFSDAFLGNQVHSIEVSSQAADIGGNLLDNRFADFMLPQTFFAGDVLLNEVLFNPLSEGTDYIELYNPNSFALDLQNVYLSSYDDAGELESRYALSNDGYLLMPESYVVITDDQTLVSCCYTVENPLAFIELSTLPSLPNDAGNVVLLDTMNQVLDEFAYTEDMHYALLDDVDGVSLERICPDLPTNKEDNWHSASYTCGWGTPGYANSMLKKEELTEDEVKIEPEAFSPDNDGYNDVMQIFYNLDQSGYVANVNIYNKRGYCVKHLAENELLDQDGAWTWDGLNDADQKARVGIYVIRIDLFDTEGKTKAYKKVCTLNARFE